MIQHKIFVDQVTVTGADDSVEPHSVVELAGKYPLVEIGILVGNRLTGPRFPSPEWVKELLRNVVTAPHPVRLSAHLCGHHTRDFLEMSATSSPFPMSCPSMWRRVQVNTHAVPHAACLAHLRSKIEEITASEREVIFQLDGVNEDLFHWARGGVANYRKEGRDIRRPFDVSGLFDKSHGEGRLPDEWPLPIDGVYCGYAGGLSPNNVRTELGKINETCLNAEVVWARATVWVDAETHLRSGNGRTFDLAKAKAFVEEVSSWNCKGPS